MFCRSTGLGAVPAPNASGPGVAAGDRLGPYEVLSVLGAGGQAVVYRCRHVHLGCAEDLAQETLLGLELSLREGTYDPSRSFNTWMWLKAHSVFVEWCRRRGRRLEPLPDGAEPEAPDDPVRAAGDRLDAASVLRAVERTLGAESYECFLLYYQGGLSQDEVAAVVGRNRKTVGARIAACHRLIDRLLGCSSAG